MKDEYAVHYSRAPLETYLVTDEIIQEYFDESALAFDGKDSFICMCERDGVLWIKRKSVLDVVRMSTEFIDGKDIGEVATLRKLLAQAVDECDAAIAAALNSREEPET